MKKNYQYFLVSLQGIISLFFILCIGFSFVEALRFNLNIDSLTFNFFSIIIQLLTYMFLAIGLCQMNEPRRWGDSPLLHYVLLTLSIDGIIVLPTLYLTTNIYLLSPILIGKIHLFSIISSTFFLILCGINQKETNKKTSNQTVFFTFSLSLIFTYLIKINSPTTTEPLKMIIASPLLNIFFIIFTIIAVLSFIPSYLKDKTTHNKLKTFSYILFTIALSVLRYSLNLNFIVLIVTLVLLVASTVSLIINMKSYSI